METISTDVKASPRERIIKRRLEDRLQRTTEAKKRAEWVKILQAMPEIRPEKQAIPLALSQKEIAATAQAILKSGFL